MNAQAQSRTAKGIVAKSAPRDFVEPHRSTPAVAPRKADETLPRKDGIAALERLGHGAASAGMNGRLFHIGELIVEMRHLAHGTSLAIKIDGQRALLLIPLTSDLTIDTGAIRLTCRAGTPLLFAREEAATATCPEDAEILAFNFERARLNAAASALLGDGRRLRAVAALLDPGAGSEGAQPITRLVDLFGEGLPQPGSAALAIEARFHDLLAQALVAQERHDELIAPARSVSEAMRLVRAGHRLSHDIDAVATLVGVTGQTLRKGFRTCLGLSFRDFVQNVRLDWAHGTLASARDGRSIADLAKAAGFAGSSSFSRAYLKRFGEPPSRTRARAVHAVRE